MIKRITLSLLLAGLTSAVYAGQMGNPVTVPTGANLQALNTTGSWSIGIEGFLVQSTAPQFEYAQVVNSPLAFFAPSPMLGASLADTKTKNQFVGQGYHAGIEVDATYHFAGNNRDVTLSYTHVEMNDGRSTTLSDVGDSFANNFNLIPTVARNVDINKILGETNDQYDAVDLVFGQHIQAGEHLDLRPFAGLRFATLDTRTTAIDYNGSPTAFQAIQGTSQIHSVFEGLGPRVGLDAAWQATSNIAFVGGVGASLLVGNDNVDIAQQVNPYQQSLLVTVPVTFTKYATENSIYAVPELDARLGLNFNKSFSPTTSVEVEVGYLVTNYFDAIENDFADLTQVNSENGTQNFGFQGPYARLQLNLV